MIIQHKTHTHLDLPTTVDTQTHCRQPQVETRPGTQNRLSLFLHTGQTTSESRVHHSTSRAELNHERDDSTRLSGLGVNTGDVGDQVADTTRVSHLVVVPSNELDKVVVEGDTGLGVEDRRRGGSDKVGGAGWRREGNLSASTTGHLDDPCPAVLTQPHPRCTRGFP